MAEVITEWPTKYKDCCNIFQSDAVNTAVSINWGLGSGHGVAQNYHQQADRFHTPSTQDTIQGQGVTPTATYTVFMQVHKCKKAGVEMKGITREVSSAICLN